MLLPLLLAAAAAPAQAPDPGISSTIQWVYVVEMSHTDVGFTDPPTVVAQIVHDNLVEALRLADLDPSFRWTVETGFQLEQFDRLASAADKARLRARFQERRFALGAGYVGPHSGIWSEELLDRFVHPAARLAGGYGARLSCALLDDVPGYTLDLPRVLARSGVEYLLTGPNDFVGGKPDIPLADRPFWWEAPDGSRVLTWETYGSYVEGFTDWGLTDLNRAYNLLGQRLPEFEAAGYPYDAVLVMRGFDNAGPSLGMADLAAQWNARYDNPKLVLATPEEFFRHLRQTYGDVFPTYRGDAAGLWESGTQITPATQAALRRALARLPQAEALQAVAHAESGRAWPRELLREAWNGCMLYLEHSGGGAGWPGLMTLAEVDQQNREFVALTKRTVKRVDGLLRRGLEDLAARQVPAGESGLIVANPLGGVFEGLIEVDCGAPQPPDLALVDPATGAPQPFRWLADDRSRLCFRARVPAHGWRRWRVAGGGSAPPPPAWTAGTTISLGGRSLELDPLDGTVRRLTDAAGTDWVGADVHRFGGIEHGYHQATFFGIFTPLVPPGLQLQVEEPSPILRRARVIGPGGTVLAEYRLHEAEDRLDFLGRFRRSALPFVPYDKHSEHYAVTFPFALQTPTELLVDGPGGRFRPGADSLPGAALGSFSLDTGAVLRGAGGRWASLVPRDSPILHLGEMNGAPLGAVEDDEIALTTKAVQHADETEVIGGAIVRFEDEPGMPDEVPQDCVLRFGAAGTAPPPPEQLRHDLAPPAALWVPAGAAAPGQPAQGRFFRLEGDVRALAFKRTEADDGYLLRLRAGPRPGPVAVVRFPRPLRAAWTTDLLERKEQWLTVQVDRVIVPLEPNAVVSVFLPD
ncbi:MAG: hypothetical protein D6702_12245 [Planctomycetota bacterium]|nr:MAG: hypothetical protein D6702_12245 [Planctomycetota bacterium]